MEPPNELQVGRFLGRYELLMPVARGGMASVWAARLTGSRGFQRVVAIKTILPSLSDDPRFEQMFLDEAALAARIRHPNVVQVLDLGEEAGLLYQVMEWIDGEPLTTFLRELPAGQGLPYPIASRILIGACEGLHAAHETRDDADRSVGLVHRDISPQNVLVTRDGVPKVVDFGVAKASSLSSAGTSTDTLKGKPAYMSPEQINGLEVDRRADIFSLGILLYVLTTSRHPFRGKNDMVTLQNVVSSDEAVLPSIRMSGYPDALEQIVMKALAKDRSKRFTSASAMARALEAAVPDVRKVGDAEVASYMHTLLADKLEAKASALRAAIDLAIRRASLPPASRQSSTTASPRTAVGLGGPLPDPIEPSRTVSETERHEATSEKSISLARPAHTEKNTSSSSLILAMFGGMGLLLVIGAIALFIARPSIFHQLLDSTNTASNPSATEVPSSGSPSDDADALKKQARDNDSIPIDALPSAGASRPRQQNSQPLSASGSKTKTGSTSSSTPASTTPKVDATATTATTAATTTTATTTPTNTGAPTKTSTPAAPSTPATSRVPGSDSIPKIRDPGF